MIDEEAYGNNLVGRYMCCEGFTKCKKDQFQLEDKLCSKRKKKSEMRTCTRF